MPPADLNACSLPDLYDQLASDGTIERLFGVMRDEDLGPTGLDITSQVCIDPTDTLRAELVTRESGIVAGLAAIPSLCQSFGVGIDCEAFVDDGSSIEAGQSLGALWGNARELLMVERPILNLLGRLSGVATRTHTFVQAMHQPDTRSCSAKLFDTRKTTPGLRHLEKYAVRCGGGHCHRLGLHDAILIKDNHIAASHTDLCTSITNASAKARSQWPDQLRFVMVEVDCLDQLDAILSLDPGIVDIVLLDNMPTAMLSQAVAMRDAKQPTLELEASGGVTMQTIASIARTGVDRISVGSLTHHAVWLDIGLDAS